MGDMPLPVKRITSVYLSAEADEHAQAVADRERRSKSATIDKILLEHAEAERLAGIPKGEPVKLRMTVPAPPTPPEQPDEIAGFPADQVDPEECDHSQAVRSASGMRRCDCGKVRRPDGIWVTP